jgi:hypothetical protein
MVVPGLLCCIQHGSGKFCWPGLCWERYGIPLDILVTTPAWLEVA